LIPIFQCLVISTIETLISYYFRQPRLAISFFKLKKTKKFSSKWRHANSPTDAMANFESDSEATIHDLLCNRSPGLSAALINYCATFWESLAMQIPVFGGRAKRRGVWLPIITNCDLVVAAVAVFQNAFPLGCRYGKPFVWPALSFCFSEHKTNRGLILEPFAVA